MRKVFLALLIFIFTGCAKDYYTSLDSNSSGNVGSLQVKISSPMKNVNLTIDNTLVAEDKFTDQIIVNNIPVGEHTLLISAMGSDRHDLKKEMKIDIKPGQQNTQLVEAPPRTTASYLIQYGIPATALIISNIIIYN